MNEGSENSQFSTNIPLLETQDSSLHGCYGTLITGSQTIPDRFVLVPMTLNEGMRAEARFFPAMSVPFTKRDKIRQGNPCGGIVCKW